NYLNLVVEETFFRMLRHREFDVAEMSLSSYTISLFGADPPFIAIPVFPSRSFRHSCIYVNADSGIREPKDLIGKRIGNPDFQMTKIFPIMHVIVIRRDVYEKNPWVAQSLYKAFTLAQREAYEDLRETAALKVMLPWLVWHTEETEKMLGRDFWPYGLEPNLHNLSTFLRYSFEQGLSKRQLTPQELFAPESLE